MIRQLATVTAAALLATTLHAFQPAAAAPTTCTKTVLPLPAGTAYTDSSVRDADPTGRYLLGYAANELGYQDILWVDGVPRWLASRPGGVTRTYAVVRGGLVFGSTSNEAGEDYWIYSARTDTYRMLKLPENFDLYAFTGMNVHQDIIGMVWDKDRNYSIPFVWPAGGRPRLLPKPPGYPTGNATHIADDGRITGDFGKLDASSFGNYLWTSWNHRPARLAAPDQSGAFTRDIEGLWIGGGYGGEPNARGLLWNTRTGRYTELEDAVADINSSGDAVTFGGWVIDRYPSVLIRSDGTRITFTAATYLWHVFDRGNPRWTTAGYEMVEDRPQAVAYKCTN
ncbi:hypothetical protein E1263_37005 [Kribbella antibiotica]|uniref:Uncharacterized protein n=1 Tax=Kribbella antibiotica TaxID=190195 RepID=A0A4R4YMD7_9ACTN|nr:hypothetical protein [Kribbella antibiotica]TDD46215.1 hypothetical protein E1263_37005 [Kribbella antibiotica]